MFDLYVIMLLFVFLINMPFLHFLDDVVGNDCVQNKI